MVLLCWELGSVEVAFERRFGTVVFVVRTWFFMTPGVVISSCFTVVGELGAGVKGVLANSSLVIPVGGVPSFAVTVTDMLPEVVTDDFVVGDSVGDEVDLF